MKKRYLFSFLFLIFFFSAEAAQVYLLHPPKGWECIDDPSQLPQKVKVIYIGKSTGSSPFNPSINIAYETTEASLTDYVALAKSYHEGQGNTRCAVIGKFETLAGEANLLQIDRPSQWGDVRFVQAMLICNQTAYVVTATCLKKDFGLLSPQLFKAIQSVSLRTHLTQNK